MTDDKRQWIVTADAEALAQAAAERVHARLSRPETDAPLAICLAGGSTPKRLYELLARPEHRARLPLDRIHWFMGDERFVPESDPRSNMGMARHALLDPCAVPADRIHAIPTDAASPAAAASAYEQELQAFYGTQKLDAARPFFDVVLMGIGPDGHTASLFPGAPALDEREHWAVGVERPNVAPFVPRVTLTLPLLGSCREMLFLASGAEKRIVLTKLRAGAPFPAARAMSANGETIWLVDHAAAPQNQGSDV